MNRYIIRVVAVLAALLLALLLATAANADKYGYDMSPGGCKRAVEKRMKERFSKADRPEFQHLPCTKGSTSKWSGGSGKTEYGWIQESLMNRAVLIEFLIRDGYIVDQCAVMKFEGSDRICVRF